MDFISIDNIISDDREIKWPLSLKVDELLTLFDNGINYKAVSTSSSPATPTPTPVSDKEKGLTKEKISKNKGTAAEFWEEYEKAAPSGLIPKDLPKVVEVVDGDTFYISFRGKYYDIRLKGIDAPELEHPNQKPPVAKQCYSVESYKKLVDLLLGDKAGEFNEAGGTFVKNENDAPEVYFEKPSDDSIGKYGRVLAYAWIIVNGEDVNVNEEMVKNGFAYAQTYDFEKIDHYKNLEKKAKKDKVGLWADCESGGCGGERYPTGVKTPIIRSEPLPYSAEAMGGGLFGIITPPERRGRVVSKTELKYYPYFAASIYNNITKWGFERSLNYLDDYEQLISGKIDFQDVRNTLSTYPDMVLPMVGDVHGITPMFYMQISNPLSIDLLESISKDLKYQESTIWSVYCSQLSDVHESYNDLVKNGRLKGDATIDEHAKAIANMLSFTGYSITADEVKVVLQNKNDMISILDELDPEKFEKVIEDTKGKSSVTDYLLNGIPLKDDKDAKGLLDVFRISNGLRVYTEVREYSALISQIFGGQDKSCSTEDLIYDMEVFDNYLEKDKGYTKKLLSKYDPNDDTPIKEFIDSVIKQIVSKANNVGDKTFGDIFTMRVDLSKNIFNDILSLSSILESSVSSSVKDSVQTLFRMWGLETPDNIVRRRKMFRKTIMQIFDNMPANINKTFPTFRVYIINPENPFVKSFEDFYDVRAVESIDIYRDKSGIDSTARVVIMDKLGHLLVGNDNYQPEVMENTNFLPNTYKDLVLRQGMKLLIYMGYTNTEKHLPRRFWGTITDVIPGQDGRIEIVAQGYGAETLTTAGAKGGGNAEEENKSSGIVDVGSTMMMSSYGDILAYTFRISNSMPNLGSKVSIFDPHYISGMGYEGFATGGFWKYLFENIVGSIFASGIDNDFLIRYIFGGLGRLMENIFLEFKPAHFYENPVESKMNRMKSYFKFFTKPMETHSKWWDLFGLTLAISVPQVFLSWASTTAATTEYSPEELNAAFGLEYQAISKTIMDVISEISNFHPGYISTILPYFDGVNYNDTIFVGKKTGFYKGDADFASRVVDGYIIKSYLEDVYSKDTEESKKLAKYIEENYFEAKDKELGKYVRRPENYSMDLYHFIIEDAPDIASMMRSVYPVQRFHLLTSAKNIIKNNIIASSSDMHNVVNYYFTDDIVSWAPGIAVPNSNKFKNFISLSLSDSISKDSLLPMDLYSSNTDPNWLLSYYYTGWIKTQIKEAKEGTLNESLISALPSYLVPPVNVLGKEVSKMYKGELIVLGNPCINPYDIVYIQDEMNDMFGFVEVEAVIDHFSYETGYVTVIEPALLTYEFATADEYSLPRVQNILSRISMKNVSNLLLNAIEGIGAGGFAKIVAGAALGGSVGGPIGLLVGAAVGTIGMIKSLQKNAQVTMLKLGKFMARNSINLIPVWYKGLPYVAGINGYRRASVESMILDEYADRPFTRVLVGEDPWSVYLDGLTTSKALGLYLNKIPLGIFKPLYKITNPPVEENKKKE